MPVLSDVLPPAYCRGRDRRWSFADAHDRDENMTYFREDEDLASRIGHVIGDTVAALFYLSIVILLLSSFMR
jgi:hypothetical protein